MKYSNSSHAHLLLDLILNINNKIVFTYTRSPEKHRIFLTIIFSGLYLSISHLSHPFQLNSRVLCYNMLNLIFLPFKSVEYRILYIINTKLYFIILIFFENNLKYPLILNLLRSFQLFQLFHQLALTVSYACSSFRNSHFPSLFPSF